MMKRFMLAVLATSFVGLSAEQDDCEYEQSPEEQFGAVTDFEADDIAKEQGPECIGSQCTGSECPDETCSSQ